MPSFNDKIEKLTDDFFSEYLEEQRTEAGDGTTRPAPVDTWQMYADARSEYARKSFPNGATRKFGNEARSVLDGLREAHKRAKMKIDNAKAHGDKLRAMLWGQQYMEDKFLPAVDALVLLGSADELLEMKEVLSGLDALVIIDGASGNGYTEALVRSMYDAQLGNMTSRSDAIVRDSVRSISELARLGDIRGATNKASKLLQKIDVGENAADDADYELLQKIVARA